MEFEFVVVDKKDLNNSHRTLFAEMLKMQGKVQGDLNLKADRCKSICIATQDGVAVAIGAIKQKTESDFAQHKADLPNLSCKFQWELGYLFTNSDFQGRKLAKSITKLLIEHFGNENLMASTEIKENPGMVKILETNGFELQGKPWESAIHGNLLGLFLKVSNT